MELKWLEDILLLLEEGSFSKAAARRNITQPAFSRRIHSLENWLGCEIVDRTTQPVTILESAWRLEPEIRTLARRLNELKSRFRSANQDLTRFDFAAQHCLAVSIFPDMIKVINDRLASLSFRLRSANKNECITLCLQGDADFLLSYEFKAKQTDLPDSLFAKMVWGRDRLIPVVGGGLKYRLDKAGRLSGRVPVLGYPDDSFLGEVVGESALPNLSRSHEIEWRGEAAFVSSVLELCRSGMGVAWLPSSLVWRDIQAGILLALDDCYESCELDIVLHARKLNPQAMAIYDDLGQVRKSYLSVAS